MSKLWYCLNCDQWVKPTKPVNVLWLVLFTLFYLVYWAFKDPTCPICGEFNFSDEEREAP